MNNEELALKEAEEIRQKEELVRSTMEKYGAIMHVENQGKHAYFKAPNRYTVGAALAKIESNVTEACEMIFNNAIIQECSDVAHFQTNEVFYSLIAPLQSLIRVKKNTSIHFS